MTNALRTSAGTRPAAPAHTAAGGLALRYRLAVLYRFALALAGGYACASVTAMAIAAAFASHRASAAAGATLAAFLVHATAFIWVFMAHSAAKATAGMAAYGLAIWALFLYAGA